MLPLIRTSQVILTYPSCSWTSRFLSNWPLKGVNFYTKVTLCPLPLYPVILLPSLKKTYPALRLGRLIWQQCANGFEIGEKRQGNQLGGRCNRDNWDWSRRVAVIPERRDGCERHLRKINRACTWIDVWIKREQRTNHFINYSYQVHSCQFPNHLQIYIASYYNRWIKTLFLY